jgi:hypothetical protein
MQNFLESAQIIGSGGYGLIIKHPTENIVGKLLYGEDCSNAGKEYQKHLDVYRAFESIAQNRYTDSNFDYSELCLPEPLGFENRTVAYKGQMYSCYYLMTLIPSLTKEQTLYHIVQKGYSIGLRGRIADEPISEDNPSRGFFAPMDYLRKEILEDYADSDLYTDQSVYRYMGFAYGVILFVAQYIPDDVEFLIAGKEYSSFFTTSKRPCFCVLDFGMLKKIEYDVSSSKLNSIAEEVARVASYDIYIPYYDDDQFYHFEQGMRDSLNHVKTQKEQKTRVLERFLSERENDVS